MAVCVVQSRTLRTILHGFGRSFHITCAENMPDDAIWGGLMLCRAAG